MTEKLTMKTLEARINDLKKESGDIVAALEARILVLETKNLELNARLDKARDAFVALKRRSMPQSSFQRSPEQEAARKAAMESGDSKGKVVEH